MNINALLPEELRKILKKEGIPSYRADQVFNWLHKQLAADFSLMTNLPKPDREKLSDIFQIVTPKIKITQKSKDGTKKYVLEFEDGALIEAVLIQDRNKRKTVCVSSQVGCPLHCQICATGQMGYKRNLTAAEIISQIELLYRENHGFENIVFMGMGEPLLNLENVLKAIETVNHKDGLNIGARKITISTVGIPHKILELAKYKKQIRLAVSLNAATDKKRKLIMPINKKYPLSRLLPAIEEYNNLTGRRATLEYVMIKEFNDLEEDVRALYEIAKNLNVNINLIPFNPFPGSHYKPSTEEVQKWFCEGLLKNKINAVLRKSKGGGIKAACGQLAGGNN